MSQHTPFLPQSVARWYDPFITIFVCISAFVLLRHSELSNQSLVFIILAAVIAPMFFFEFLRLNQRIPLRPDTCDLHALARIVAIKWVGVMAVVCGSLFLWWLFPLYRTRFNCGTLVFQYFMPYFAVVLIPYLFYTEWRLGACKDYAWHIGRLCLGRRDQIDWGSARDGALSMLVRTIFLPFNLCFLLSNMGKWRAMDWSLILGDPTPVSHSYLMQAIYAVLIFAIVPGYIFSLRLLNTHTRNIDRTWMAWIVTMACYAPLNTGIWSLWFSFKGSFFNDPFMKPWIAVFSEHAMILYAIGIGIIISELLHLWGEAILGIRSSNLTNRGVITNGPFRYLRHPIYLSKCIGWALIFVPFVDGYSPLECVRLTILFAGICLIYYLRSITEERMLSEDPDYVAYALWVDKNGWLAWAGRRCPVLTFAWRHAHWHKARLVA